MSPRTGARQRPTAHDTKPNPRNHPTPTVNFVDTQHRSGLPYPVDLPLVVGIEAAGIVSAIGVGVEYAVGDRVAYGGIMPGVYAEMAVVPEEER